MCPKFFRWNRSVTCRASEPGWPSLSNQAPSLNPEVSTTNVSPSQRPTEITRPGGIRVSRKCAVIDEYLTIALNGFKKDDDEFWRGDDLERVRRRIRPRYSAGNAVTMRIVFTLRRTPLVVHVLGPRKHHQLARFQVFRTIQEVAGRWRTLPES